MNISKHNIFDFLSEYNYIEICAWQRDFVWKNDQLEKLYSDITEFLFSNPLQKYFLGVISYRYSSNEFSIELIDGKQRIIALNIFICALCDYFKINNYKKILLLSPTKKFSTVKLKFYNSNSQEIYENMILNDNYAYINNSIFTNAYRFFTDKLENDNYTVDNYINALKHFEMVELIWDNNDDVLSLYNNMNLASVPLNIFDKIKTFVLVDINKNAQGEMVVKYWESLQQLFSNDENLFLNYLVSYISMQTETEINRDNIISEFSKFYKLKRKYKKSENILPELYKFAQYYIRIINGDFTQEIAEQFDRILKLSNTPKLFSFLFAITDDFQNAIIPQKVFIDMLSITADNIENHIINKQSIEFSSLSQSIAKLLAQKYEE